MVLPLSAAPLMAAETAQTGQDKAPAVSVVPAAHTTFTETILVTGSLVPRREILVAPQIEGFRIRELLVDEGDHVAKDQVLARLTDETLKAQLAQLEASLAKADASIAQAQSRITEAEATKKQADAAFARAEDLIKSGTTSRSTYDEREAAARTAAASLTLAQDGLKVSQADKTQIEAQIRESKLRLSYTDIKAPEAGIISRRTARIGALASAAAEPLFRIIADGEIELEAEIPEIYLPHLTIGMSARIDVASLKPRQGKLRLISPEVTQATRLGRVRIFIGADDALHIGSFARATIDTASKEGLAVPATAVLNREGNVSVQVVKDGRVETRKVVAGMRVGGKVQIVDGLQEGELVVLRSGTLLQDGDVVRPVVANEAALNEAK
jgi:RND family efflux transporter MFP subunit